MTDTPAELNLGICILFFERVEQTIECVHSLLPSRLPIYLLNNGSTRRSRDHLASEFQGHQQVTVFDSERNLGIAAGRNFLIFRTTEPWLLMIDDDIVTGSLAWPDIFRAYQSRAQDVEVFIPRLWDVPSGRYAKFRSLNIRRRRLVYEKTRGDFTNWFPGGNAIVSRRLFERLGTYDEEMFVGVEDVEFGVRGLRSGSPIRAQFMPDMEFFHNHRQPETLEDRIAALERYCTLHIEGSYRRLADKHGLIYNPRCADPTKASLRRMLDLNGSLRFEVALRVKDRLRAMRASRTLMSFKFVDYILPHVLPLRPDHESGRRSPQRDGPTYVAIVPAGPLAGRSHGGVRADRDNG